MICVNKKCAAELPDDAVYCLRCGRKQIQEKKTRTRGTGMGTAYRRTGSETWTAEYTVGWKKTKDGKRRRIIRSKSGFATKKEALEYIDTLKADPSRARKTTLSGLYDGWSSSAMEKLSKSKQCSYRIAYGKIDDIAGTDISLITIDDLQDCVNNNTSSYYTAKDVKQLLSHLYDRAIAMGWVSSNLAKYIVLPDLEEAETTPFSEDAQKRLWEDFSSGNDFPGYLLLMIYTGMMPGELLRATKDMINWQAQTITDCGLKTKKRKETPIILPDIILPVLARLCETEVSRICPLRREDFYNIFAAYKDLMDFDPSIRPYSCRHSSATALDAAGVAPSIIKEIMRHTRFATTERYIHKDTAAILAEVNAKIKSPSE